MLESEKWFLLDRRHRISPCPPRLQSLLSRLTTPAFRPAVSTDSADYPSGASQIRLSQFFNFFRLELFAELFFEFSVFFRELVKQLLLFICHPYVGIKKPITQIFTL